MPYWFPVALAAIASVLALVLRSDWPNPRHEFMLEMWRLMEADADPPEVPVRKARPAA